MKKLNKFNYLFVFALFAMAIVSCKKKDTIDPKPEPQPVQVVSLSIDDLKKLSTSASVAVPDGRKIKGIVISDATTKNIDTRTIVLQEATGKAGIVVTFDADHNFAMGDEIEINVSKKTLAKVDEEIILQRLSPSDASKTGTGTVTPKETTTAEIATNKAAFDGTLVSVAANDFTPVSQGYKIYFGTFAIKDAAGIINSRVASNATFLATQFLPSVSKATGIVRISGNDVFLDIRNTSDVIVGDIKTVTEGKDFRRMNPVGFFALVDFPGSILDPNFTVTNKKYQYMFFNKDVFGSSNIWLNDAQPGIKTVTVTFAGSQVTGNITKDRLGANAPADWITLETPVFNPATDYFQVGVCILTGDSLFERIMQKSATFKEAGKFYSVTFTLPTKEQIMAAGASEKVANNWLATPRIGIANFSFRAATGTDNTQPGKNGLAPMLIEKVEYGY